MRVACKSRSNDTRKPFIPCDLHTLETLVPWRAITSYSELLQVVIFAVELMILNHVKVTLLMFVQGLTIYIPGPKNFTLEVILTLEIGTIDMS